MPSSGGVTNDKTDSKGWWCKVKLLVLHCSLTHHSGFGRARRRMKSSHCRPRGWAPRSSGTGRPEGTWGGAPAQWRTAAASGRWCWGERGWWGAAAVCQSRSWTSQNRQPRERARGPWRTGGCRTSARSSLTQTRRQQEKMQWWNFLSGFTGERSAGEKRGWGWTPEGGESL